MMNRYMRFMDFLSAHHHEEALHVVLGYSVYHHFVYGVSLSECLFYAIGLSIQ